MAEDDDGKIIPDHLEWLKVGSKFMASGMRNCREKPQIQELQRS